MAVAKASRCENLSCPPAASFFHTLKTAPIHHRRFETREQARQEIFKYIKVFYNRQRKHPALGYRTPLGFEQPH